MLARNKNTHARSLMGVSLAVALIASASVLVLPSTPSQAVVTPESIEDSVTPSVPTENVELPAPIETVSPEATSTTNPGANNPSAYPPELEVPAVASAVAAASSESQTFKNQIFLKTNSYRGSVGRPNLAANAHLEKIAQDWANHMATNNDYRHNPNFATQVWSKPGWNAVGENIAYGYSNGTAVSEAWWNSPGHKANIVHTSFNSIGIGYAKSSSGRPYYVQVFGQNLNPSKPTTPNPDVKPPASTPFADVKGDHKFYKEINWMATSGISTGASTTNGVVFNPKSSTSREAMAAFLFRQAKVENYKAPNKSPFKDVPTTHKFYKEIAWMHEAGISTGTLTAKGKVYSPKSGVTREAMAAFLFRLHGDQNYKPTSTVKFADVKKGQKFYKEIAWMASEGVSSGSNINGKLVYNPKTQVTREAMAAFLYRTN